MSNINHKLAYEFAQVLSEQRHDYTEVLFPEHVMAHSVPVSWYCDRKRNDTRTMCTALRIDENGDATCAAFPDDPPVPLQHDDCPNGDGVYANGIGKNVKCIERVVARHKYVGDFAAARLHMNEEQFRDQESWYLIPVEATDDIPASRFCQQILPKTDASNPPCDSPFVKDPRCKHLRILDAHVPSEVRYCELHKASVYSVEKTTIGPHGDEYLFAKCQDCYNRTLRYKEKLEQDTNPDTPPAPDTSETPPVAE